MYCASMPDARIAEAAQVQAAIGVVQEAQATIVASLDDVLRNAREV